MKTAFIIIICAAIFFCLPLFALAQNDSTKISAAPKLEFVCELTVSIGKAQQVGETGMGTRRIIPILGGTFRGPNMQGIILPGGADWQLITKDGIANVEARYTLQTDDSTLIYISNKGIRVASQEIVKKINNGEVVSPDAYYFRTVPLFETANPKYQWLMKSIFIAKGIRNPNNVVIQVWSVE